MILRDLPDPNHSLYDSRDFIISSRLAKKAFLSDWKGIALQVPFLIDAVDRLMQSCHLAEFTNHGLVHLCSLVDRISHWTINDGSYLVEKLKPNEAAVLLVATLIHDMGMLSQKAEDLPPDAASHLHKAAWADIPAWVRKTHVIRLERLVKRLLDEMSSDQREQNNPFLDLAIKIATAHEKWPWDWDKHFENVDSDSVRFRGLAAIVAVSDLLDEDATRCDALTLLQHRHGTPLNMSHWLRHLLTDERIMVKNGGISVRMLKFDGMNHQHKPVFGALRNHFRLVLIYEEELYSIGAAIHIDELKPTTGIPSDDSIRAGIKWKELHGFGNESALCYQLLQSFMGEALKKNLPKNIEAQRILSKIGLEDIDLDLYSRVEGKREILSYYEKTFRAFIDYPDGENLKSIQDGLTFLKTEATNAHLAGDGIHVFRILEIASYLFNKNKRNYFTDIQSTEIEWYFSMWLYWGLGMIDIQYDLHNFEERFKAVSDKLDPLPRFLIDLTYQHFHTYLGGVDVSGAVNEITKERLAVVADNDLGVHILLPLLVEHIWLRHSKDDDWILILRHTLSLTRNDTVLYKTLADLEIRLSRQRSLIYFQENVELAPQEHGEIRDLIDGYRRYLNAEWAELEQQLQSNSANYRYFSVWHSLARVSMWNISPDSFHTQISRWFSYISDSLFEKYISRLDANLSSEKENEIESQFTGTIPVTPSPGKQLLIIQQEELHSLRKWDLIRYRFALTKKAKSLMNFANSVEGRKQMAEIASYSILVFAMSMSVPEKDVRFHCLFNHLFFGPLDQYEKIVDFILQSPKNEWVRLAKILDILGDAIPESRLEPVVDWYLRLEAVPVNERMGDVSFLKKITAIVRYAHNAEHWINRLLNLYQNTCLDYSKEFCAFVIEKGTKEQVLQIWSIRLEQLAEETDRLPQSERMNESMGSPTETKSGNVRIGVSTNIKPKGSTEIIWEFGFEIIRSRADMREDLRSWMETNCPDDPNDRHNLAQVLKSGSEKDTEQTCNQFIETIKNYLENPSPFNPIVFQLYGKTKWPSEQILPLLDLIETNITEGNCYAVQMTSLFAAMTMFMEDGEKDVRKRLVEICIGILEMKQLPIKPAPENERFVLQFMNIDQPARLERSLLQFAENALDSGGGIVSPLVAYLQRNFVLFTNSSNSPYLLRLLTKLSLKTRKKNNKDAKTLLSLFDIAFQTAFFSGGRFGERNIANIFRVMDFLFNSSKDNPYYLNRIPSSFVKDSLLASLSESLPKGAESEYPSVRATACEILFRWKIAAHTEISDKQFIVDFPDDLNTILEKLKDDPNRRVRNAYQRYAKR